MQKTPTVTLDDVEDDICVYLSFQYRLVLNGDLVLGPEDDLYLRWAVCGYQRTPVWYHCEQLCYICWRAICRLESEVEVDFKLALVL